CSTSSYRRNWKNIMSAADDRMYTDAPGHIGCDHHRTRYTGCTGCALPPAPTRQDKARVHHPAAAPAWLQYSQRAAAQSLLYDAALYTAHHRQPGGLYHYILLPLLFLPGIRPA